MKNRPQYKEQILRFYSYDYLVSHTQQTNTLLIVFIVALAAVAVFLFIQLLRKKLPPRFKELTILLFILAALLAGVQISDVISQQDRRHQYQSNVNSFDALAEKLNVSHEEIFISTPNITPETIYKVRGEYYKLYWSDEGDSFLAVKLDVIHIDPETIIDS